MDEWWETDDGDTPQDIPRRDHVPDSGFTDPRIVTAKPKLTQFIPPERGRRRARAWVVTVVVLGLVVWPAVDLARWTIGSAPEDRAIGLLYYIALGVKAILAGLVLWRVWARARERDWRENAPLRFRP